MASLATLRDGLKRNLETVPGLRVHDTIPDNVNPPFAVVLPASPPWIRETMARGVFRFRFRVLVGVSRANERASQDNLDGYVSTTGTDSVLIAVESDRTLSGDAQDVHMVGPTDYGVLEWGGTQYTGAEFEVEVLAT